MQHLINDRQRASILTGAAEPDRSLRAYIRSGITDEFREAIKCRSSANRRASSAVSSLPLMTRS
ncbi:MAG: hypothetical protein WB764_23550 [Xanthobacteraceae bacterium]